MSCAEIEAFDFSGINDALDLILIQIEGCLEEADAVLRKCEDDLS